MILQRRPAATRRRSTTTAARHADRGGIPYVVLYVAVSFVWAAFLYSVIRSGR
jgi:hypothetical protein